MIPPSEMATFELLAVVTGSHPLPVDFRERCVRELARRIDEHESVINLDGPRESATASQTRGRSKRSAADEPAPKVSR